MNKLTFGLGASTLAIAALGLSACGDETTTNITEQTGMQIMAAGEKMDKCDDRNAGEMIFVTDSSAVFYCADGKWQTLNGKDGADGMEGKPGTAVNGEAGKSCTAADTISADGIAGYNLDCADKRVGTIWSGKDGEDGKSCSAQDTLSEGGLFGINIDCGGARVGTIWNGVNGVQGYSAYEIAVQKGFDGTEEEWLNSFTVNSSSSEQVSSSSSVEELIKNAGFYSENCPEGKTCKYVTTAYLNNSVTYGEFLDTRDYQVYKTVEISNGIEKQIWMAQNLNYAIEAGSRSWCGGGSAYNEGNCSANGRLYKWSLAVKRPDSECGEGKPCNNLAFPVQGICPEGWHLPSKAEAETLLSIVGAEPGKALKAKTGWPGTNGNGIDSFGFSAKPVGYTNQGYFWDSDRVLELWTSESSTSSYAYYLYFYYTKTTVTLPSAEKSSGRSIRCVKN